MNTDRFAKVDWISDKCKQKLNVSIEQLGPNFEELTRTLLLNLEPFLKSSTGFKIRLVIDTNIVIKETKRLLRGDRPFLSALLGSPFLNLGKNMPKTRFRNQIH